MDKARTELSFVSEAIIFAKQQGFTPLKDNSPLTPGARYYDVNRDRAISMLVIGKAPFQQGINVLASHIDSPRLELKGKPLYDKGDFALFQTNYHGSIKNYQWTNIPLALIGHADKKDGFVWVYSTNKDAAKIIDRFGAAVIDYDFLDRRGVQLKIDRKAFRGIQCAFRKVK